MWISWMEEYRRIMYQKLISPLCKLEVCTSNGVIDKGLGLYLVNALFKTFLCGMLLDYTSIQLCYLGSDRFVILS